MKPREYADYCMKKFDFSKKIDTYYFPNGFSDFMDKLNSYGKLIVTSIDNIDEIFSNNEPETILAWLSCDNDLLNLLEKDVEPSTSQIELYFKSAVYTRYINGNKMKNFLRWKFMYTSWLNTESSIKQSPYQCTTATTINQDFSPLIEKPVINKNHSIFKKYPINNDKLEYLFQIVELTSQSQLFQQIQFMQFF